ncbi:MAG: DUF2961 domain-containing protein [Planctomycetota bacterium]|nr:DUF2961 domain-containing protein [Planctomycetota bacterium]
MRCIPNVIGTGCDRDCAGSQACAKCRDGWNRRGFLAATAALGAASLLSALFGGTESLRAEEPGSWQEVSRVRPGQSRVVPALWGNLPKLNPGTKVKILDVDGPGVVSVLHVCNFGPGAGFSGNTPGAQSVLVRVFYDQQTTPAIAMPLMDFLGDIQCQSALFNTVYFTKVKHSHNFRLPMPFRKHITIELENPSEEQLAAYTDVQWEQVDRIPDDCGYLRTDYRSGTFQAGQPLVLCELNRPATIVAHWLQYESEKSVRGEQLCEGDHQIFLDGDDKPTLNYLGSEDAYGFSWGFQHGVQWDGRCAIVKLEDLKPSGSRVAALRCRVDDAIRFQKSCRWLLTYENDAGAAQALGAIPIPYRHCVYYYAKD